MYGYELVQALKLTAGDVLAFGEGCIYPILHRLEAAGHLSAQREAVGGRSRVVYRLTTAGRQRLGIVTARWRQVTAAIDGVLQGGSDGTPALA